MESLLTAFNCVFPIFVQMFIGYLARRSSIVPEETFPRLSVLCFRVLLPLMMFCNLYTADFSRSSSVKLVIFLVLQVFLCFLIGYLTALRFVPDRRTCGTWTQAMFRSNIAVIGISLAETLVDKSGVAAMTVAIAFIVPLYNALAVFTLESFRGTEMNKKQVLCNVAKNPLILGSVFGIIFHVLPVSLPDALFLPLNSAGKAGSVLVLIALGASFRFESLKNKSFYLTLLTAARLVAAPALGLSLGILAGLRGNDLAIILVCAGSPLATPTFPMAQAYNSDYELAGQLVVTTSLLFCVTMFLWIFSLKQLGVI